MICIAGKNNIACEILEFALRNYDGKIYALPNSDDLGIDGWQRSFLKTALQYGVEVLYDLDVVKQSPDLIFLSLEFNELLDVSDFKSTFLYNIHFSLLPKYKGMYTSAWPILNNEKATGVTLHLIDSGIDTGDIIDQMEFGIDLNDTARDLYFKYINYSILLVKSNWKKLIFNEFSTVPQNKYESTYYDKKSIDYKNLKINMKETALGVHNQIRAFSFQEYQMPVVNSKTIFKSIISNNKSVFRPGKVLWDDGKSMMIATIDYDILLYYY